MICKYCNSTYSGRQCPACGKVFPLVKRSTDLDILMAAPPESSAEVTSPAPVSRPILTGKSYDEGVREGYQKGLQEGYKNGYQEGNANGPVPQDRFQAKKIVSLCAASFLLAAVLGSTVFGFVEHNIGYRKAEEKYSALLQSEQEEGSKHQSQLQALESEMNALKEKQEELEKNNRELADKNTELEQKNKELENTNRNLSEKNAELEQKNKELATEAEANHIPQFPYSMRTHGSKYSPIVAKIQKRLNELGIDVGTADGYYGRKTENGVKAFQRKKGLHSTGIVDEETYYLLFPDEATEMNNPDNQSNSDETAEDPINSHTPHFFVI